MDPTPKLRLQRTACHPETSIIVLVDEVPTAYIYLDEQVEEDGAPAWCLCFLLPGTWRTSSVSNVMRECSPYEPAERAVWHVLRETLTWDFPEAPERSARLEASHRTN